MLVLILVSFIQLTSTSPIKFPKHVDLQKVGEVIFKNEKYNVLKPTTHVITDHFEDTMLRRDSQIDSKRVFIDHNGFRHYWSGFEEGAMVEDDKRKSGVKKDEAGVKKNETDGQLEAAKIDTNNNGTTVRKINRKRPKRIQDVPLEPITPSTLILRQSSGKEMTIAKTTFFCPFIGVMTMHSRLE